MKVAVVGLGSMGKRRVRNLQALGIKDIAGFDQRPDRRAESHTRYGIKPYDALTTMLDDFAPDAVVISTSPESHMNTADEAVARGLSCFIEASVVEADRILALHKRVEGTGILMAPSCTMRYFPGPKKIKELLESGAIGRPLNVNYQTGQYLPDWHPWERIEDFYVSRRETGGAREIVPFELTWINDLFGQPQALACVKAKVTDMPADIDDIYHCMLRYSSGVLANLTVEVVSRPQATRDMRILGGEGEIVFSADENCVRCSTTAHPEWTRYDLGTGSVESGYINPEEPYIAEMQAFVNAVTKGDKRLYPNTLADDYAILQTLNQLESLTEKAQ